MTIFNIANAFEEKKRRGWDKLFWVIDLHQTVIQGKYNRFNVGAELFPHAQEVLQYLYSRPDICLILWTSSHDDAIKEITERLDKEYGIRFSYINENPEVPNTELCDFSKKFYFNVLIDDKGGADENCWKEIKDELIRIGEWEPAPNLYVFSSTHERGTAVRDIMDKHKVENMQFQVDEFVKFGDETIIRGFWWRGYVEQSRLEEVRKAFDDAGHPWFREPEKVLNLPANE